MNRIIMKYLWSHHCCINLGNRYLGESRVAVGGINTPLPLPTNTIANLVAGLPALQKLVDLGMDLFDVDTYTTTVGRRLVCLDWHRDIRPKLLWLTSIGVATTDLGAYLTRNPYFLLQDLDEMRNRVDYLRKKNFERSQIAKIVVRNRYWLNEDMVTIDARLGWIQRNFDLDGNEMRALISKEPRIIQFGIGPLQRLLQLFHYELGFSRDQMRSMLQEDPRLFLLDVSTIETNYVYLTNSIGLSNRRIAEFPLALRCHTDDVRCRHEYLKMLKRDQYDPQRDNYVPLSLLMHADDRVFCAKAALTNVAGYNAFLKTR